MTTKQSSSSLRNMSDRDLQFLESNESGLTFSDMKRALNGLKTVVKKVEKGTATEADLKGIGYFSYAYAGYDGFFTPFRKGNYKRCLKVLDKDISDLTKKLNSARMKWQIATGVKTEVKRRKLKDVNYDISESEFVKKWKKMK